MSAPDDMTPDGMTPDDALAMDYALGALPREARQAAALRMRSDAAFRALVEDWQALLAPLDEETAPVLPPASVWNGVMAEIGTPVVARAPEPVVRRSIWQSLALWRGLALGGPVLAAFAVAMLMTGPTTVAPAPVAVADAPPALLAASLAGADGKPLLAATWDPLRGSVVLTPVTGEEADGGAADRVAELWVIEGDRAPRSLGIIETALPNAHAISSQVISGLQPGAVLAISIEPNGGSPTGLPTGPVIATGKLISV